MMDYKASQMARAVAAQALQAANPHLVPISAKVDGLQAAAKNMRIELARAFPGIKFSVKSERFSMGDAIRVRWMDGPNGAMVDQIIDRYAAGSFNGMDDSYNYSRDAWKDAFGDAKYVSSNRDHSDKAIASAARYVFKLYGFQLLEGDVVEAYRNNRLYDVFPAGGNWSHANSMQALIGERIARAVWCLPKQLPGDLAVQEAAVSV